MLTDHQTARHSDPSTCWIKSNESVVTFLSGRSLPPKEVFNAEDQKEELSCQNNNERCHILSRLSGQFSMLTNFVKF